MGKPTGKKKSSGSNAVDPRHSWSTDHSPKDHNPRVFDQDTTIFIEMAQEMKDEGNKLFQRRDYESAMLKYEKAIKLLPRNHVDVAYLHSNMAACYMQMFPAEYHRAIDECNLALEVSPKYSKALLKRARCYEAMNRLDLACRDIDVVLSVEPNNLTALEISERVKKGLEKKGIRLDNKEDVSPPEVVPVKERIKKKKSHKIVDKAVVEVKPCAPAPVKVEPSKAVKLVFGEDIRLAQIPGDCSMLQLREIVLNRFPALEAVLIKYKDKEGDLVTITTSEELRWAEESSDSKGSAKLHVIEVNPEQDPLFEEVKKGLELKNQMKFSDNGIAEHDGQKSSLMCIDHWIVQFARLLKNHVGFNSDACLDLHELGVKLYSEAMEETVTSEDAQPIFELAAEKFQEMAALAMFNWGNVHMSRARKRLLLPKDASENTVLTQVEAAYEWAKREYNDARKRYEEAVRIKPDFYEGLLALGQEEFEHAKLSWNFAIGSKVDLDTWPSSEVIELFNNAEDNMERGTKMWEEVEEKRINELSEPNKEKIMFEKLDIDGIFKGLSSDEAAEQASSMRSQINILWGTMLYERSVIEFELGLPTWEDCLIAAVEKFKLAGASPTDIAVMIKNHCANESTPEGLSFNIEEIVQAWNEMYDAKRWISGIPSFRLEPLFRRRVPKLHDMLAHS